jgi:hypothetical protein
MRSWFAAHWRPEDLPGLWCVIRLYDQMERGNPRFVAETRMWMGNYGITPAGAQQRRCKPPEPTQATGKPVGRPEQYGHLRPVDEDGPA